jgi:fibronectin type 3 domain-containing protein
VPSTGEVDLAWDPVPGAGAYTVYRSGSGGFPLDARHRFAYTPAPAYSDAEVEPNTTYHYAVSAVLTDADREILVGRTTARTPAADEGPIEPNR